MTENEIVELIRTVIGTLEGASVQPVAVTADAAIISDLGLDSLDYATVLIDCESALDVQVLENDVDWREIRTVGDLARLLAGAQRSA